MPAFITVDVDPVLLAAGPVTIRWYGVMISVALVLGTVLAVREAARRGIHENDLLHVTVWAVPFGLLGARLFHVVDAWKYYATYPLQILALQEGGLDLYGGLVGGIAGGLWAARQKGLPSWKLLDVAAPSLILGQAVGRVGCFINGDHQGLPTSLPWATSYVNPASLAIDSTPRHPAQLYELLYDLVVFALLLALRPRLKREGLLFLAYAALYSFGRFWISAFREDAPFLTGLKEAQVISVAVLLVAMPLGVYLWRRPPLSTAVVRDNAAPRGLNYPPGTVVAAAKVPGPVEPPAPTPFPPPLTDDLPLGPRTQRAVLVAQRTAVWIARHWLALANGAFLLAILGAMAVPAMRAMGLSWLADPLFAGYHLVCHQSPDRSFQLFGHPMAFCQRDVAVYGSIALAGIAFAFVRNWWRPLPWRWYLLSLVPLGIDGFTQLLGMRESNWLLRLSTGGLFGVATVWLAYPHLERFAQEILAEEASS